MEILIVYNEFRKYGGERMQEPADLLGFNIPALKVKIDETKTQNGKNVNNKDCGQQRQEKKQYNY